MANTETDTQQNIPASPSLVAPREAAVVNGKEVTFVWRPVDDADAYVLQVAADARFENILVEEELGEQTAATIAGFFPTDEQTFFWRVLATNEAGWSRGERVESFVSATAAEAGGHQLATPDVEEDMGPVPELARSASEEISERMFEGASRLEKEKEMGVAIEGIVSSQILGVAVAIMLSVSIAVIIIFNWLATTKQQTRQVVVGPDNYPELRQAEVEAARQLQQYDVISEEEGIYRIPIDRAMDIIANEEYQQRELQQTPSQAPRP